MRSRRRPPIHGYLGKCGGGTVGTLIGGPAVGAVSAAVGGYVGSLAGTAGGLPEGGERTKGAQHPRPAGMMLAVRIANSGDTQRIIERLRQHGAADVERAKGTWENGDWVDFDPIMPRGWWIDPMLKTSQGTTG